MQSVSLVPRVPRSCGPLGLALRFRWGDQIIGEFLLPLQAGKVFSIGTASGVDFFVDDSRLGNGTFELVRANAEGFELRFTRQMKGELWRNGAPISLEQLIESGEIEHDGAAYCISLDGNDFAWVDLGAVLVEVTFQP